MRAFDSSGAFAPSVPAAGKALKRLAVRGAGMTVLSGAIGVSIQIVSAAVLGRMLTPRDFGLVTMVTTFSLLLMNGTTNGFTDAILQRKEITHALASSLFWINLGGALFLSFGFAAAAPLVARFYGEGAVAPITMGLSATVFLSCLPAIHLALLRRAMRYSALAKNDILARILGVCASIVFALLGWGYWALVMGACVLALSTLIGAWVLCPWLPGAPRWTAGSGEVLGFGSHITGRFSLNYFARNSDNLLVGWRFGAHALGFYKKAYDLFALSASQLVSATSNVAVSALSRVREDRAQYLRYLLGAIGVMAFIGMGLAGDLTLIGKDLIRLLLGPGWETAGHIFTFFAPGIGVMIVYGIHGWIHVSLGRADRWFVWGMIEWGVTCALFLVGLPWGPQGMAVAWCASFWILVAPAMWFAGKPIGLSVSRVMSVVWRYVVASALGGTTAWLLLSRLGRVATATGEGGAALRIGCGTVLFAVLYLALVILLHGGLAPLKTIAKLMQEMRPGKGAVAETGTVRARVQQETAAVLGAGQK